MQNLVGLPTELFADEELAGAMVRLRVSWPVGDGMELSAGECFRVMHVYRRSLELPESKFRRWFQISNHRTKYVPVEAECCELVLEWPQSVKGKTDRR